MDFVQMTHRGRLGHESPYALIERALNEKIGKRALVRRSPQSEDDLRITAGASKLIRGSAGLVLIFFRHQPDLDQAADRFPR